MTKFGFFAMLLMLGTAAHAGSYECYRYVGGSPTGTWIKVDAGSKSEAESKAMQRFRELGGRVDSVNCK